MNTQLIIVLALTFVINLITTLSYSVRIVGVRTGRIAISFALFNALLLISRTANGFQAPLLAKTVENDLKNGISDNSETFRLIIWACTFATIAGGLLIPTFQRILSRAVLNFSEHRSMGKLLSHGFTKFGIVSIKQQVTIPSREHIKGLKPGSDFPMKMFIMNIFAVTITTIGVLSAVYASYLNPEFRTTASSLSAFINGFGTILMFIFIDPHLSIMTDDVVLGKCSESTFRKNIVYMVIARVLGTLLAQLVFIPAAILLAWIANYI